MSLEIVFLLLNVPIIYQETSLFFTSESYPLLLHFYGIHVIKYSVSFWTARLYVINNTNVKDV